MLRKVNQTLKQEIRRYRYSNLPSAKFGKGGREIPCGVPAVQKHWDVEGLGEAELQLEVLLLRLLLAKLRA